MAVAALVLGIIGTLFSLNWLTVWVGGPMAIVALVLGILARKQLAAEGKPTGMATAGLVLGIVGTTIAAAHLRGLRLVRGRRRRRRHADVEGARQGGAGGEGAAGGRGEEGRRGAAATSPLPSSRRRPRRPSPKPLRLRPPPITSATRSEVRCAPHPSREVTRGSSRPGPRHLRNDPVLVPRGAARRAAGARRAHPRHPGAQERAPRRSSRPAWRRPAWS